MSSYFKLMILPNRRAVYSSQPSNYRLQRSARNELGRCIWVSSRAPAEPGVRRSRSRTEEAQRTRLGVSRPGITKCRLLEDASRPCAETVLVQGQPNRKRGGLAHCGLAACAGNVPGATRPSSRRGRCATAPIDSDPSRRDDPGDASMTAELPVAAEPAHTILYGTLSGLARAR